MKQESILFGRIVLLHRWPIEGGGTPGGIRLDTQGAVHYKY